VGRDLKRKLSREDRVIGAILCDLRNGVEPAVTSLCAAAGMRFRATDETGRMHPPDRRFAQQIWPQSIEMVLQEVCGLGEDDEVQRQARDHIRQADSRLREALMAAITDWKQVLK
jgi:mannitol-1-phosphate 5-dehydrogenase